MLLTPTQQAIFDDESVTKSVTLNFYESMPTFLYPSVSLHPSDNLLPGTQNGVALHIVTGKQIGRAHV